MDCLSIALYGVMSGAGVIAIIIYLSNRRSTSVDLKKLEKLLDEALDGETPESLKEWIEDQRKQYGL